MEQNKESWYIELKEEQKYVYDLIHKNHKYFSDQDKKYRKIVRLIKLLILFLGMVNTIVLGLKTVIDIDMQIMVGLIISALISFTTAISTYFNFERYWMRNIITHIELNVLRDNFIYDIKAGDMSNDKLKEYRSKIDDLQKKNIKYWKDSLKKSV